MRLPKTAILFSFILSCVALNSAQGAAITYSGALVSGVTLTGSITQPVDSFDNPVGAQYYSFSAVAGELIEVFGDRLDGGYDMAFWIMDGLYADTDDFAGAFPGPLASFVVAGDDEDAPNIAGPFGDPHVVFLAPLTGSYTVAVTNFLSSGPGPFSFELTMNNLGAPVPEPGTLGLLTVGSGIALVFRRRAGKKSRNI